MKALSQRTNAPGTTTAGTAGLGEDGDAPGAVVAQILGCDGRIVQEAIAAIQVVARMVPGRAAQREGGVRAAADLFCAGQRHVRREARRLPGAIADRCLCSHCVIPELSGDRLRHALGHAPCRPAIRNRLSLGTGGRPLAPGARQEFDVSSVMHTRQRLTTEGERRDHLAEALAAHPIDHKLGALG